VHRDYIIYDYIQCSMVGKELTNHPVISYLNHRALFWPPWNLYHKLYSLPAQS